MTVEARHDMTSDVASPRKSDRPESPSTMRAWIALADFVLRTLGLFYPQNRLADLRRNFAKASVEFGYPDELACIRWIVGTTKTPTEQRAVVQVLAKHLTIGETYFLRDRAALDAFESSILPSLIHERRMAGNLRLRIWCAACCTGEEAYTLAILVHRLLPDLARWQVTITASDLNLVFLQKAREAVYGEWSFRDAPAWLKANYFKQEDDGRYRVTDEIRGMVDFVQLNLVDAQSSFMPSAMRPEIMTMDVVFCRNVLMYFDSVNVTKAVEIIEKSLVANGWLAVGPGETASISNELFSPVSFPGAVLLKKNSPVKNSVVLKVASMTPPATLAAPTVSAATEAARLEAARLEVAEQFDRRARRFVSEGRSDDALAECDRWLLADKLDAAAHYLRGAILMERADHVHAQESLQRAAYLDPDYVLAHVGLGHEALRRRDTDRAAKHFANAKRLLSAYSRDDPVSGGDGITAEQVSASVRAIQQKERLS